MLLLVLVALGVPTLLVTVHWYLWRRLVKDVSRKGGRWRRLGTALIWLLPLTTVAAMVLGRSGAPFPL
ncbi:metallophosphoesterase, partial [Streptomyces sp. TR02-1]